jgi:hypothetical protein
MVQAFGFFTDRYWIWAGVGAMVAFYAVCTILTWVGLKFYSGTPQKATVGGQ